MEEKEEIKNLYVIKNKENNLILKNIKKDIFVEEDSYDFKYWLSKEKAKESLSKFYTLFEQYKRKLIVHKIEFGFDEDEIETLKSGYKEQKKTDEMVLYKKINKMCKDCEYECKESSKHEIIRCKKTIGNKNIKEEKREKKERKSKKGEKKKNVTRKRK